MAKPLVYVETTIPSFYHTNRTGPFAVARREWTRRWWVLASSRYDSVTSDAVLDELADGDYPSKAACLGLARTLPLLEITPAIAEIVDAYARHRLMPADRSGDALHLAVASYRKCEFLLTWNCRHLANANKFGHIRRINTILGLFVPALVTPLALLGGSDEPFD